MSLASDLGLGQPMKHVVRQTAIAMRLADQAGLDPETREAVYYVSLLAWVGCTADSADLARLFGDDLRVRADSYQVDLGGLPLLSFMVRSAGSGASPLRRLSLIAEVLTTKVVERSFAAHCESAAHMASELGLPTRTRLRQSRRHDTSGRDAVRHAPRPPQPVRIVPNIGRSPDVHPDGPSYNERAVGMSRRS